MTEQQAARAAELQYVLIDIDRISELTKNVAVSMQTEKLVKKDKKSAKEERVQFSQEASKDIQKSMELVSEMYNMVMKMVNNEEANEAENLVKMKEKIRKMDGDIRKGHIKRVHKGKCKAGLTAAFNEILHNVERIGNSCVNRRCGRGRSEIQHIFKRDGVENFIMSRQTFNRREFACFLFHGNPFDFMLIKEEKLC